MEQGDDDDDDDAANHRNLVVHTCVEVLYQNHKYADPDPRQRRGVQAPPGL